MVQTSNWAVVKRSVASPRALAAERDLRSVMQGDVVVPDDESYADTRQIWNGAVECQPALFALCETASDVQAAIRIARKHGLPLSVRGGGHDMEGRALCHDGLVINLTRMRSVEVDVTARIATVLGGARAEDLIGAASAHDLVAVTGVGSSVGLAGLTLGGGYGPLMPRYGLALDNLLGAEVVLADGQCVKANSVENADLFWALRGGGGNFGVVISMQIRLHELKNVLSGLIRFPWTEAEAVLRGYAEFMMSAPDELAATASVSFGPDGSPGLFLTPTWSGELTEGELVIAQLQRLGTPILSKVGQTSYSTLLRTADAQFEKSRYRAMQMQTRWQVAISPDTISSIVAAGSSSPSPLSVITVQSFHGAPTRVPLESTAFGLRQRHFLVLMMAAWELDAEYSGRTPQEWVRALWRDLAPDSLPGGYANLLGPEEHEQIAAAYGSNSARLKELKRQLDPDGVFSSAIPLPL